MGNISLFPYTTFLYLHIARLKTNEAVNIGFPTPVGI